MKITVFITSYNQRKYLKEAIDSVLSQTLPAAQIIIVDDCSIDGSQDIISDYLNSYPELFTPIFHKENTGVGQVRIDALNAVTSDFVTYVDGDDRFLQKKLEKEAAALHANPNARIACSNNYYISEDGSQYLRQWVDQEEVPQGDVFWQTFARAFPKRSLFRMELVEYDSWKQIGFHDPRFDIYEDFDMRIRLTKKLSMVYVDEPLSEIRTHRHGLSNSALKTHFLTLDKVFRKNEYLLEDLSPDERRKAKRMLGQWTGDIGIKAFYHSMRVGQFEDASRLLGLALHYRMRRS